MTNSVLRYDGQDGGLVCNFVPPRGFLDDTGRARMTRRNRILISFVARRAGHTADAPHPGIRRCRHAPVGCFAFRRSRDQTKVLQGYLFGRRRPHIMPRYRRTDWWLEAEAAS